MARRRSTQDPAASMELNLAPIMNVVMILIPLLLVMVQFDERAISPFEQTSSSAGAAADTDPDEPQTPRVTVSISEDGFRLIDQRGMPAFAEFTQPISGCPSASAGGSESLPPTICNLNGETGFENLNYAALYNRLVEIRLHQPWREGFNDRTNAILSIVPENATPAGVIIKTMDLARYFLVPGGAGALADPTEGTLSDINPYLLGGGDATLEALSQSTFMFTDGEAPTRDEETGRPTNMVNLFPDSVLLMSRAGG